MTALTKEEVIAQLQLALEKQSSESVDIVQKGSWYKINDGKSLRFSELEQMLTEVTSGKVANPVATKVTKQASVKAAAPKGPAAKMSKASPAKSATKSATKAAPKTAAKTSPSSQKGTGMTPKELWRAKITKVGGQAPRGC
jgi:uncharacterized lipoprotein YajG